MRSGPRTAAPFLALVAFVTLVAGAGSRVGAQPPTGQPVPEGTVIAATVDPPGLSPEVVVPPAGYETLVVEPPPPPVGYGAYSLSAPPGGQLSSAPPSAAGGGRTLRILAESGAWLLATVATVGISALVANATDPVSDPSPLLLSFFTGYFVVMPIATWLGGRALDGEGSLGWTIFGHAIFGLIGAVAAFELSHDTAVSRAQAATATLQAARAPGLSVSFTF